MEPDFFCPICQSTTLVPTKFVIFKDNCCRKNHACLRCARNHLGLNKNKPGYARCPWCNSESTKVYFEELKQLPNYQLYQIDKDAMKLLTIKALNGSIKPFQCDCDVKHRDQKELLDHIRKNCPESTRKCKDCNNFYLLKEEKNHQETCLGYPTYHYDDDYHYDPDAYPYILGNYEDSDSDSYSEVESIHQNVDSNSYTELNIIPQSIMSNSQQNIEEQNSNYLSDNDSISSLDEDSKDKCLYFLSDYYFYLDKSKDFLLEGRITDAVEFKKKSEDAFSLVIFYRNWIIEKKFRNNWTNEDFLSNLVPI